LVESGLHGGASGQNQVLVLLLAGLNVHAFDGGVHEAVDGGLLAVDSQTLAELGVEHDLGALEQLLAELDDLLVGQFDVDLVLLAAVVLFQLGGRVLGDLALLLLDLLDELLFVGLVELNLGGIADEAAECLGHGSACHGVLADCDFVDVAVDHGHGVAHSVAHVEHGAGGLTCREEREHGLDVHLEAGHFEVLEEDFSHLLLVLLGVERGFGLQAALVLRLHLEAVGLAELPDFLHLVPVADDAVDNGLVDGADRTLLFSLAALEYLVLSVLNNLVLLRDPLLVGLRKLRHVLSRLADL